MDISRPDLGEKKRKRKIIITATVIVLAALAAFGVSRLPSAVPQVDSSGLFIDVVKRGPMVRQVRGTGVLVPELVRWIPASTEARVDRIVVRPGTIVKADTVILELSNPEVEQAAQEAELQLGAAIAEMRKREVELQSSILAQQASAANIEAQMVEAKAQADVDEELSRNGLTSALTLKLSRLRANELASRSEIEKKRLEIARKAADAELAVQRSRVEQVRALANLRNSNRDALRVRAGIDGVLQQLPVEIGQRVPPGTPLARVAQPEPLKAELRVAETQARDVAIGQSVVIDTRVGTVNGRVTRVDPSVQNGTIGVDVGIEGVLPKGARPDLTVDGVIELERLADVLYTGRPVQGSDGATIALFRVRADGHDAVQTNVTLGRTSVNSVEIKQGLREGDRVILSDMSAWSEHHRIRLE
ncbi:MAG: RND transporter [Acidobacteria bacterium]|nr:MAG: RND transporter [Acidobacteriota bacterium]